MTVWPSTSSLISMSPSTRLISIRIVRRSGDMRLSPMAAIGRCLNSGLGERELRADAAVAGVADLLGGAAPLLAGIGQARLLRLGPTVRDRARGRGPRSAAHRPDHRRGVDRAGAQVDHRHARARAPLGPSRPPGLPLGNCRPGGLGGVGRGCRNAAERGAGPHRQHIIRLLAQGRHDVALGPAFEGVEHAGAVRTVDDAAFDAEQGQVVALPQRYARSAPRPRCGDSSDRDGCQSSWTP